MHTTADIQVIGARENNLRDVSVTIPKGMLTVFTGVSGSGKSSLVFDTIAAESQRQLNETFSAFIRNRLPQFPKPDVDVLANLAVAILVDQKPFAGNSRSTVGTATDLAPLLRLLFSRHGEPFVGYSNVFSFNDPAGMCPECQGLGTVSQIDVAALLDRTRSLDDGAIRFPTFAPGTAYWKRYVYSGLFDRAKPIGDFTPEELSLLLDAAPRKLTAPPPEWPTTADYLGILPRFRQLYLTKDAAKVRQRYRAEFDRVVTTQTCPLCHGDRLNQRVLTSTIAGRTIADVARLQITDLIPVIEAVTAPAVATVVAALLAGLANLTRIGLGYLSLDRVSSTLSGGEAQRVKMVRHLSSSLTDLTYILDEPTTGLHPRDVRDLTQLLFALRDKGNTVLIVEHDPDMIVVADQVIDLGPGAGSAGGQIVFQGSVAALRDADTPTGRYLRAPRRLKSTVRQPAGPGIAITRARTHNLQDVSVTIPTQVMTVVTGVAGSGKSSLINEELARQEPAAVFIDQTAIRGSRRSSPATFLQILDPIRREFARANHVGVEWFSPNSAGACPVCKGLGVVITDLAFMDDLETPCEACQGTRFNETALSYLLQGRNIHAVLATTVADADQLFATGVISGAIARLLKVGLGYITLGQPLSTLSGGERQRLKLARELETAGRLYVFDEPTTGLHGRDTAHLLALFDELVDDGATLIVIEHNLDVMAHADWIIDLGPGPGRAGGRVIFAGPPAALVSQPDNATADHLRAYLANEVASPAADRAAR